MHQQMGAFWVLLILDFCSNISKKTKFLLKHQENDQNQVCTTAVTFALDQGTKDAISIFIWHFSSYDAWVDHLY